jgi:hypothetical protein
LLILDQTCSKDDATKVQQFPIPRFNRIWAGCDTRVRRTLIFN